MTLPTTIYSFPAYSPYFSSTDKPVKLKFHQYARATLLPNRGRDHNCDGRRTGWCCQLTDLVYDGVFEVLQWLLFLSAVPPVQLLTGWCVTAKAPPDISAISALIAVKHGNYSSLTPPLSPVRTRKSLIWPWMASDVAPVHALWALASTRFYVT